MADLQSPPRPPSPIIGGYTVAMHHDGTIEWVILTGTNAHDLLALHGLATIKIGDEYHELERKDALKKTTWGRAKLALEQRAKEKQAKKDAKERERRVREAMAAQPQAANAAAQATQPAEQIGPKDSPEQGEATNGNGKAEDASQTH